MTDMVEIKTAIAEIRGEMRAMIEIVRSGDRDSNSGVRLLAETVKNNSAALVEQRADLKAAFEKFDERTIEVREYASRATSAVRVDLEKQLREHADAKSPHPDTLGGRVGQLESSMNRVKGALALFLALPSVAGIMYLLLNGVKT